jgi:SAM-dependent methyltransferase
MRQLSDVYPRYSLPDRGGDKGTLHSYIEVYEREMVKTRDIDLLEIGVWEGHSLAMWDEYLQGSRVVGLDVDVSRCRFTVDARVCDATNPEALALALGDSAFDYIIDDGSHRPADQIASFNCLWQRLKPNGKYFIEDIAGDKGLGQVSKALADAGIEFVVYDLRSVKGRFDDILLVACRD